MGGSILDTQDCLAEEVVPACIPSKWSEWSEFGECSASCGESTRYRTRYCIAGNMGDVCEGSILESQDCLTEELVPGCYPYEWSEWSDFGECSATCGEETVRSRSRVCIEGNSGDICVGDETDTENCFAEGIVPRCIPSKWSEWTEFGDCSATCGESARYRTRYCIPGNMGDVCEGSILDTQDCLAEDLVPACIPYEWSDWSDFGECSATCGENSVRSRSRVCNEGNSGDFCVGDETETENCFDEEIVPACIPSHFSEWTEFGECSATCGESSRYRTRDCIPGNMDDVCEGSILETQDCLAEEVVDVCGPEWGEWSECSATCG